MYIRTTLCVLKGLLSSFPHSARMTFFDLPLELHIFVLGKLDYIDLGTACRVHRLWRSVCQDSKQLWAPHIGPRKAQVYDLYDGEYTGIPLPSAEHGPYTYQSVALLQAIINDPYDEESSSLSSGGIVHCKHCDRSKFRPSCGCAKNEYLNPPDEESSSMSSGGLVHFCARTKLDPDCECASDKYLNP